jgi:hypothetical protein
MTVRRAFGFVLVCALMGSACGGARPTHTTVITPEDSEISKINRQLTVMLPNVLMLLAQSDIRLAGRIGHGPGGDPFTLATREQDLESAERELQHFQPPKPEYAGNPRLADAMLDKYIVDQLLASERARLAKEHDLGGASIDILSGVLLYVDEGQSRELEGDKLLAWRLKDVRDALKPNSISGFQREELRTVLAAMAKHGPTTDREVQAMLKHLEKLPVAPYPLMPEAELDKELAAFMALPAKLDAVEPFLEKADQALRFQIDVAFGVLAPTAVEDVRRRAMATLAKPPPCLAAANVENARQMGPPDERARACGLVRALSIAQSDIEELAALLALREAVVTAARSALMHGRVRDPVIAARKWPRLLPLSAEAEQRELLLAANHPTKAIAGGAAAGILTMAGGAKTRERAREWMRFGDADFEAIDRHLAVMPRTASATSSASGPPKAPPR